MTQLVSSIKYQVSRFIPLTPFRRGTFKAIEIDKLLRPHPLYFLRRLLQKDVSGYLVIIFCVLFGAYMFWQLFIRKIPKDQVIDYKIANEVIYGK